MANKNQKKSTKRVMAECVLILVVAIATAIVLTTLTSPPEYPCSPTLCEDLLNVKCPDDENNLLLKTECAAPSTLIRCLCVNNLTGEVVDTFPR